MNKERSNSSTYYEIRLQGHLSQQWIDWFEGFNITLRPNGETMLAGSIIDQAALHGLLKKVRDLGLPLLSIMQIEEDHSVYGSQGVTDDSLK